MKTYEAKDIRNVLLVGHGGAGKTTLLEAMLFTSGATTRMGTVEDGNTVSDFEAEEIKKGISVSLGMAPIEWNGVKINVLDAPGYADFIGDVRTAIRAVDAVLLVVSAVDGVEVQTEVAWELAVEAGLPRAILINKLDRERASFERTLEQLVQSFGTQVAPLELPLGEEHDFEGVADLLGRKAYRYGSGPNATEGEWPDDISGKADPFREKLMEAVAESDDALIEKYLEEGELSEDEVVHGVKRGFAEARIAPVLCAAAARPLGVDRVLQFVADEFPSPIDRGPVTVVTKAARRRSGRATPASRSRPTCSRRCPTRTSATSRCSGCSRARCGRTRRSSTRRRAPRSGSASCSRCGARNTRRCPRCRRATSRPSRSSRTRRPATRSRPRTTR